MSTENTVQTEPKRRGRPPKAATIDDAAKVAEMADGLQAPAKRGRKKSGIDLAELEKPAHGGSWSSPNPTTTCRYFMHVEYVFDKYALGTLPNDTELYSRFIASNAPDAKTMTEEIEAVGEKEVFEKSKTIYPKGDFFTNEDGRLLDPLDTRLIEDLGLSSDSILRVMEMEKMFQRVEGIPFLYDYQIRGAFKDQCGLLNRAAGVNEEGKKVPSNESSRLKSYKKVIDGGIFVFPRRIPIIMPDEYLADDGKTVLPSTNPDGTLKVVERPIRISDRNGERVALAASEMIPAGSRIFFSIAMTNPEFKSVVCEWLDYCAIHGISGWRNSGIGTGRWREVDANYQPFAD